mgnify:CR=1 FL=1|jgi:hypothetical protein
MAGALITERNREVAELKATARPAAPGADLFSH